MNPFIVLYVIALFNFLIIAILIFLKRKYEPQANILFSAGYIIAAYDMLIAFLLETKLLNEYTNIKYTFFLIAFLHMPLLYLYIKLKKNPGAGLQKKDLLHIVPFFTGLLFFILFFYVFNDSTRTFSNYYISYNRLPYFVWSICVLYMLFYLLKLKGADKEYKQILQNNFSSIEKITLNWLRKVINVFFVFMTFYLIMSLISPLYRLSFHHFNRFIDILAISLYHYIGYHALLHTNSINLLYELNTDKPIIKYKKSSLSAPKIAYYKKTLVSCMSQHRPYLNDQLTLSQLAESIDIPAHQLSQLLNQHIHKTFFEFINEYRIEEAKKLLSNQDYAHMTIVEIMTNAGFNTKSTFNSLFKNNTNLTPSKYRTLFYKKEPTR